MDEQAVYVFENGKKVTEAVPVMPNADSPHSLYLIFLAKRRNQTVYKTFYSLARESFSKDMRSTDGFLSTGYKEALKGLGYLQKSKGIGLVIGDPGAGKHLP